MDNGGVNPVSGPLPVIHIDRYVDQVKAVSRTTKSSKQCSDTR